MLVNKERNLISGFDFYSVTGGMLAFAMVLCMPIVVTFEVFLRRNMGQRFFNGVNYWAGFIAFAVLAIIFNGFAALGSNFVGDGGSILIFFIWFAYVIMGIYHFIYQWWRDEAKKPTHSLSMGYPRLEPLGKVIMSISDGILSIIVRIVARFMPIEDREFVTNKPILTDSVTFTYRVIEPMILVILAVVVFTSQTISNVVGIWLFLGAITLSYSVNLMLEMERHQALNIRDQILESTEMQPALRGESDFMRIPDTTRVALSSVAQKIEDSNMTLENVKTFSPSIAEAVAALNPRLKNLGKEQAEALPA